ncbi:hypothetical protein PLESTB_001587600 [Pleodorina starrii]|uniref:Uncharacterized protein n=1 Tax=Pleodorina starrii TaxID=330485 RepID=A0A9W6BXR8_9CHLO|nr:hypothetical protein PLESTM_000583100 [Pleodorina starrii]GLC60227.1 hypothetical protein PLESTB_001587600 [Pleodorina starrii]GLC65987.1 hypothetical protein PLESTF_000369600 [Pleodorina starrii]
MTRLALTLLTRLGQCRGSSLPTSSALLDNIDIATAASDGCSTSSSADSWCHHRTSAGISFQAWRSAVHNRYNFIQPVDTKHINSLLDSATRVEHAAIPVLQYGAWFDPEQVTRTLQRLPRMLRYQRRKSSRAAADGASVTSWRLLDALGSRLAQVAPDCTNEQLTRALWAYGVSRRYHADVLGVACKQLPRRLPSMTMPQLATTAWSLAAAASLAPKPVQEPVREALQAVARHLVTARPANLSAPAPPAQLPAAAAAAPGALAPAADVVAAAVAAGRAALAADQPWMDHRSALKLAWAFAALDVRDAQALDVIADASVARMSSQLQAQDRSSGPLAPRATYLYRTIRGWQAWPRPRPPRARTGGRPSRYLRDERPRVVLRDFTLPSLAALLAAFRRLGHRHEGLLQASAQHVVASSGPTLRVAPADLTRLTGALEALRFRHGPALSALLSASRLSDLPAPVLARLTILAAEWRVPARRRGGGDLYGRLARQLVARAWIADGADRGAAKELLVAGGEGAGGAAAAEAAAVAAAAADGGVEGVPELDPRARESWDRRLPSLSWRTDDAILEREEEQWGQVHRRSEDGCGAAELARAVLALAKAGYTDPDSEASPLVAALFSRVWPHLAALPADALADLALAAVHYGTQLDGQRSYDIPPATACIRDATRAILFGTSSAASHDAGLGRRLLSLAGYGSGGDGDAEALTAATADQAAELRQQMGLSASGALRLALALALRPEAVAEKELRAALSLLDVEGTGRQQLGELVRRMRQGGRNALLPPRLLASAAVA